MSVRKALIWGILARGKKIGRRTTICSKTTWELHKRNIIKVLLDISKQSACSRAGLAYICQMKSLQADRLLHGPKEGLEASPTTSQSPTLVWSWYLWMHVLDERFVFFFFGDDGRGFIKQGVKTYLMAPIISPLNSPNFFQRRMYSVWP